MKLPFDFGVKLILRLVIPGFLLSLGLYAPLARLRDWANWTIGAEYLLILSGILFGWIMVSCDQLVYMLFEGRRFWPPFLKRAFLSLEQRRLRRNQLKQDRYYALALKANTETKRSYYDGKYRETSVKLRAFPMNKKGHQIASSPTRLGNLIDSYESYPDTRYGVHSIFHWYRLELKLDKDLREDLDTKQAMADSVLYASLALFIDGLAWLIYHAIWPLDLGQFRGVATFIPVWVIGVGLIGGGFCFYRLSLYPQAQFGESFKSVFDVYEKDINVSRVLDLISHITGQPLANAERQDQLRAAWLYLQYDLVKCPKETCKKLDAMSPTDFKDHDSTAHAAGAPFPSHLTELIEDYYPLLARAAKLDKQLLLVKVCDCVIALAGIFLAYYTKHYGVILLLPLSAFYSWFFEASVRSWQDPVLSAIGKIEEGNHKALTYPDFRIPIWRRPSVLLPHMIIAGTGIVLVILAAAGAIPLRF